MKISLRVVPLFVGCVTCLIAGGPFEQATLRGITTVQVVVEDLNPDGARDGLTKYQISTDVELRLRRAGVKVGASRTSLYVQATLLPGTGPLQNVYAYNVFVALQQPVEIISNGVSFQATTWSAAYLAIATRLDSRAVRNTVGDLVDQFLNDYLAVNPK